jgi:23S rRNA (adenine2503-C2)-methyltransferase
MNNFFDLTLHDLEATIENLGLKPYRARQIFKWVYQQGVVDFEEMGNLPKGLRITLRNIFRLSLPDVADEVRSQDGSTKFGFLTDDAKVIESVLIPDQNRNTLCVSSQIGCKMACRFCVTGKIGFIRNLSAGEIVGQVMAVKQMRTDCRISNIVFMGMGEPLDNVGPVLKALEILEDQAGLDFSHRRITLSTVGLLDPLKLIPGRAQIAVSLNAASNEKRSFLMPINRIFPVEQIVGFVRELKEPRRERVTFEYIVMKDINDSLDDARALAGLLKNLRCKINLIPYNESPYTEFLSPDRETIDRFHAYLLEQHFTAIIRDSRGQDVFGGCGQLGAGYLKVLEGGNKA